MKHTLNVDAFIQGIKGIKALTFGGANFVNESLDTIRKSGLNLRTASYIIESASNSKDAAVRAFAKSQKNALNYDSFAYKASMVMEDLMSDGSENMAKAASTLEDTVDVAVDDTYIVKSIAVDGILDNYNMYPEVAKLIELAKSAYYAQSPTAAIETGACSHLLAVVQDDLMGLPLTQKWYTIVDGALQYYVDNVPTELQLTLDALSLLNYNANTEQFSANTIVGTAFIAGQDAIECDGQMYTTMQFAEKVKAYMQLNQVTMQVEGNFESAEAICNAVITIAQNFTYIVVLDNSIKLESVPLVVYSVDGTRFNVLNFSTGVISVYDGIIPMLSAIQSNGAISSELDCVKSMWSDAYDGAMRLALKSSAQLEAYNTVLVNVNADIDLVRSKMQAMDPTTEGYAAHQQILDSYIKQRDKLQSRIAELTAQVSM